MTKSNSHDDCDCESYIPAGLIKAIIAVMVLQSAVVVSILAWTTSQLTVSPGDGQATVLQETDQIDEALQTMLEKIDWIVVELSTHHSEEK